jgi:hypothetical protein
MFKKNIFQLFLVLTFALLALNAIAQDKKNEGAANETGGEIVTVREGQNIQFKIDSQRKYDVFNIVNKSDLYGDADFVALDDAGNLLDQGTAEVGPKVKSTILFANVLQNSKISEIASIWVQISLRERAVFSAVAVSNPITFFSQLDPLWKSSKMGTSGKTIGSIGCVLTSVAMAGANKMRNTNPGTLNTWLSANNGYTSSGDLYWAKPPGFDPTGGFKYIGSSFNGFSSVKSAANLKALIDGGYYVVSFSYRFNGSNHWVVIYKYHGTGSSLSDFEYLDPADASFTYRTVDGVKVRTDSQIRVYR